MESQSGGGFTAFAEFVLAKKGVVYGASLEDDQVVRHRRVTQLKELVRLKGSKYVQSETERALRKIGADLSEKKTVLFSGTPCQVDGVIRLLSQKGIKTDNLYTCDLICHGTPSPAVFKDYLSYIQKGIGEEIEDFCFRDKRACGWHSHAESFCFTRKTKKKKYKTIYTSLFYKHLIHRPSCYCCPYASLSRVGDVTIGDFWGVEKILPKIDDNKGVSLVLVNTKKGYELLERVDTVIAKWPSSTHACLQPQLIYPPEMPINRDEFWREYHEKGPQTVFHKLEKKQKMLKKAALAMGIFKYCKRIKWRAKSAMKSVFRFFS